MDNVGPVIEAQSGALLGSCEKEKRTSLVVIKTDYGAYAKMTGNMPDAISCVSAIIQLLFDVAKDSGKPKNVASLQQVVKLLLEWISDRFLKEV